MQTFEGMPSFAVSGVGKHEAELWPTKGSTAVKWGESEEY
jgi:hypothetical protein